MRAAWRLARSALWTRRSRSALLAAAVTLSTALVAAVACAMGSVNAAVEDQLASQFGTAQARLRPAGTGKVIPFSVLEQARAWAGVERADGVRQTTSSVAFDATLFEQQQGGAWERVTRPLGSEALLTGYAAGDERLLATGLIAGRLPEAPGEIVIDALLAQRMTAAFIGEHLTRPAIELASVELPHLAQATPDLPERVGSDAEADRLNTLVGPRPGDTLRSVRLFGRDIRLTVVGVSRPPPLGGRPQASALLATVDRLAGGERGLTEIALHLEDGTDAEAFVASERGGLPAGVLLQTTERITSGIERNLDSNKVGFIIASVLAFMSAAFIIMTGLTTGLAEQQRSLAVVRAIGATRGQLAIAQLLTGGVTGLTGALLGTPLGVLMAWTLLAVFRDSVPGGLRLPPVTLTVSVLGSVLAGLGGALWPAYRASRLRPIEAMATRASAISNRLLVGVGVAGLLGIGAMIAIVGGSDDGQFVFWGYATIGLPAMFIGYFLVSVPAAVLCGVLLGPVISRVLGLPRGLLTRVIRATPFRHGFTAGAMMAGLALMVSIWTNGGSVMRDWLGRIEFPDAFVSGLALSPEAQARVDALPFVNATAAITLHPVEVDFFGVRALQQYKTTFVAFEPAPFMEMAALTFVEGDEDTARARLEAGGAVIVAREFRVAQGLGLGDTFICRGADGVEHEFEIVGVVTSPGLELVSKFFNIGDEFIDQALHAVFGSRKDLRERFGSDAIQLIQVDLADDADDAEAIATIRRELFGAGILDAGSGRQIKQQILTFVGGSLVVFSAVAVGSMLVACFGVANLIVAGIHARRYELGVLRAIGGSRGLLVRLVAGEAIVIALAACVVGTCMGVQAAWAGQRLYETLIGIGDLRLVPPIDAILWGCVFVLSLTLLAAAPAAAWLNRRRPVELVAGGG
ncbi:MAG: FtsX-like permease family protein [Planctomycetota bacterium]